MPDIRLLGGPLDGTEMAIPEDVMFLRFPQLVAVPKFYDEDESFPFPDEWLDEATVSEVEYFYLAPGVYNYRPPTQPFKRTWPI